MPFRVPRALNCLKATEVPPGKLGEEGSHPAGSGVTPVSWTVWSLGPKRSFRFALAPWAASSDRGVAHRPGKPPTLPVGGAPPLVTQRGAGDVDLEDLARMRDDQIPDPLGHARPSAGDRMLASQGLLERAPLRVREAEERSLPPRVRHRGPAELAHEIQSS